MRIGTGTGTGNGEKGSIGLDWAGMYAIEGPETHQASQLPRLHTEQHRTGAESVRGWTRTANRMPGECLSERFRRPFPASQSPVDVLFCLVSVQVPPVVIAGKPNQSVYGVSIPLFGLHPSINHARHQKG